MKTQKVSHELQGIRPGDLPDMDLPSGAKKAGISWFAIQFVLPVDNPVDNVRKMWRKNGYIFEVPINTPDLHKLTYADLLIMAEEAEVAHPIHRP